MTLEPSLQTALEALSTRAPGYRAYQDWYDGSRDFSGILERVPIRNESLRRMLLEARENLCPIVVDACADRLRLNGVDAPGMESEAAEVLSRSRIDALQMEVHRRTIAQGDGYLLVWAYPGERSRLYFHQAWEMTVVRDPERPESLLAGLKTWEEKDGSGKTRTRLTVYRPDRIERYHRRGGGEAVGGGRGFFSRRAAADRTEWQPFAEGGPSVQANPLGVVPIAVFNNGRYRAEGSSELRDVVPLQRLLDKSLIDLALASDGAGMPVRHLMGYDYDLDPNTGKPRNPFDAREPLWVFSDRDTKIGQLAAADLEGLSAGSVGQYRSAIARVSRTPMHYFGDEKGGWPSGEALRTAEASFTAKVDSRKWQFGEPWEDAIRFALMFDAGVGADFALEAKWADTRPRAELDYWNSQVVQHQLGKSLREIWTEEGYSDEQIAGMFAEAASESAAGTDALGRVFAGGGPPLG